MVVSSTTAGPVASPRTLPGRRPAASFAQGDLRSLAVDHPLCGLAAAIDWHGDRDVAELLRRLLARIPHRGPERQVLQGRSVSLGVVCCPGQDRLAGSGDGSPACVADIRLDNREELRRELAPNRQAQLTDPELLLLGYQRWGVRLADHLIGDFAFVLWDPAGQSVYAARDPFGSRPLFVAATSQTLFLASEIEQLLAVDELGHGLNDDVILDYLQGRYRHGHETLFAGIRRLQPGHWLWASAACTRQERYWQPPRQKQCGRLQDSARQFQELFRGAVANRLNGERAAVLQLSGGLDSSAIVCMASHVFGSNGTAGPRLHLASAVYPGMACDETPYIDAVAMQVPLPLERWNGMAAGRFDQERPCVGHPWAGSGSASLEGDFQLAQRVGATTILSGFGGDELLFERGIFRDLARHGRWLRLLEEMARSPGYSTRNGWFFLRDALRELVPPFFRRAGRRLRGRGKKPHPPSWLGARLRPLWPQVENAAAVVEASEIGNQTAALTWQWLNNPNLWWSIELQELRAARQGIQLRWPFLDRRLAEFVLSLPFEHRLPHGNMKQLLRRAMANLVPVKVLERRRPTTFDAVHDLVYAKNRSVLEELCTDGRWLAQPYVDRDAVRLLCRDSRDGQPGSDVDPVLLMDITQLELWLRFLARETSL